jgi:hypothetical protein
MSATVVVDERNGASAGTLTSNITNTNMGSVDAFNLDPVVNSVVPGANTYEKYQQFDCTALGGSSKIDQLQVWRTGALGGSAVHVTNARTATYGGAAAYVAPIVTNSTAATQAMPTSAPGAANLGIGGALAGSLIATGSSDYLIHQIQTNAADTAGSTSTMNYQWRETA